MEEPLSKKLCLETTDKLYFVEHFNSREEVDNYNLSEKKAQEYMDDLTRAITLSSFIYPKNKLQLLDINYLEKTQNSLLIELRCHCPNYLNRPYHLGGVSRFLDNLKTNYLSYLNNIYHLTSDLMICVLPDRDKISTISFTIYPEYRKIITIDDENKNLLELVWEGIGIFLSHSQKVFRPTADEVLSQIPENIYQKHNSPEHIFLFYVQQSQETSSVGFRDVGKINLYKYPKILLYPTTIFR